MDSLHYNNFLGILIALGPLKIAIIAWVAVSIFEASERRLAQKIAQAKAVKVESQG